MTRADGIAELILGVDVGTSAVKVVAFAPGSSWRCSAQRDLEVVSPEPGHQVQDPDALLVALAETLAEVVQACGPAEVIGLSIAAAMHGLVALDAERRPLTPLITWADTRAADEAVELHRSGRAADLQRLTGTPVHPMSPLTKLLWFARRAPSAAAAARWWVGLKDLVLHWLTGELVTELSSASGTGLLDLASGSWSTTALDLVGVDPDRFPHVLPTTAVLPLAPQAAAQVGLRAGTPVVVGAADGPLANVGAGALSPGVVGLSLGTSAAARTVIHRPDLSRLEGTAGLFCYAITDDLWVTGGALSNGGSVGRWASATLVDPRTGRTEGFDDDAVIELARQAPPGSEGLIMLPFLLNERAPLWGPDLHGAFIGLRAHHGRAHLARAAVEGVCLQVAALVDRVNAVTPVRSVRATGGVFGSGLWGPILAACLGRPLHVVDGIDGTARGAAALGLLALGRADDIVEAIRSLGVDPESPLAAEPVDPAVATAYAELATSVGPLIDALGRSTP